MNTATNKSTVLVTGASSGLGFGIAEAFVNRGANVVLNARNEGKLHDAAKRLGAPDRTAVVVGDVGRKETGQKMVELAVDRFGRVDVLVNNGGHFYAKAFTDYTEEDLDGFLTVHLKGTYFASQAAARRSGACACGRCARNKASVGADRHVIVVSCLVGLAARLRFREGHGGPQGARNGRPVRCISRGGGGI